MRIRELYEELRKEEIKLVFTAKNSIWFEQQTRYIRIDSDGMIWIIRKEVSEDE